MEITKPKAIDCYPAYGNTVSPFPQDLSPKKLMENDRVYLYNPLINSQRFLPKSPNAVTLLDLQKHFIVDKAGNSDIGITNPRAQALFKSLKTSWDSMLDYVAHQLSTEIALEPKTRSNKRKMTPDDIKAQISDPTRKIEGPKLTKKLAPPRPK